MPRSKWKIPFLHSKLEKSLVDLYIMSESIYVKDPHSELSRRHTNLNKSHLQTYSRSSSILSSMVGLLIYVHNGKKFLPVRVKSSMVGKKLGEFSFTRKILSHKKTKKK